MPTDTDVDDTKQLEPLLVKLARDSVERDEVAEWGSWYTYSIGPAIPAQQVLPTNRSRKQSRLYVNAPAMTSTSVNGRTSTGPAAGVTITSMTLQPGVYTVNWSILSSGTTAAAEINNYQLTLNGVLVAQSSNGTTSGTLFPQTAVTITVTQPNSTLAVITGPATPTATAAYIASLTVAPSYAAAGVKVGTRGQVMNNAGGLLTVGGVYTIENKQELWAASDGVNSVTLTVLDERFR